jgi:hypothetical protein
LVPPRSTAMEKSGMAEKDYQNRGVPSLLIAD